MKKTVIPTLNKKSYPITTFSLCLFILILYFIIFLTSLSFSQRISNSGFDKQSVLVLSVIKKSDPYDSVNDIRKIDIVGFYMDVSGYVQYKDSINTHPATSSQQQGNVVQGTHTVGPGVPNVNTQVNPLSNTNVKVYYFDEGLGSSIYLTTITLDANGMGSFDLGNVNSFPKNCRTYIFQVESTNLYDGTIEKVDVCKITSDMIDFRQTLVDYFNNNPTSVFACVSAFILLGVLFAFAFSSGVNPLRFWDINTPRLPKAKIPRINRLPMMGGFWELTKRFRDNIKTFIKMRETYRNRANEIRSEIRDNIRRLNSKLAEVNQRIAAGQGTADLKKLRKQLQKEIREENERLRDLERIVHKLDRASLLLTILSFLEIGTKKEDGISWTALYWLKMRAALGDRAAREILTEWKRLKQTGNIANLKSQNFRALLKQSFDAELNALALLIERMERAGRRRSKLLNLVDESLRGNQVGSQLDKLNRAKTAVREVDREYHKLRDIINRLDNEISNIINNNSRAAQRWEINAYRGQSSYNSLEEAQNALKQFHVDQQNFKYTYLANIHKTNVDKIDINQVPDVATLEEISRRLRGEKTAILELETIRRELMFMGSMFTEYSSAELQKMRLIYENTFGGILGALYSMPVFGKVFEGFSYYSIWGVGSSLLAVRGIGEMFLSPIVGLSIFVNRFGWYRNSINRVIDAHTNFLNILTSIANNQNLNPIWRKFASSYVVAYPKVTELIHSLLYAKDVGFVKARDIKIGHVLDPDQKVATETVRNHDQILGLLSRDLIEHLERDLNNINDPNLREQVRKIIESYRARDNEGLRTTTNTESLVNETTRLINLIGSHNRELANRIIELRDFYNGSNNLVNEVKNLRTDGVTRQNKLMELRALIENNEQLRQYRAVIKALYHMKLLAEPSLLENWLLFSQDERNVGIIENETTRSRMQIGEAGREMRELIENTLRAEFERLMNARNTRNPNDIIGTREFNENILERAGAELFSILSRRVIVHYLAVEMPNVPQQDLEVMANSLLRNLIAEAVRNAQRSGMIRNGVINFGKFSIEEESINHIVNGNEQDRTAHLNRLLGALFLSYNANIESGLPLRTVKSRLFTATGVPMPESFQHEFARRFLAEFSTTIEGFRKGNIDFSKIIDHNVALLDAYYNPSTGLFARSNQNVANALSAMYQGTATEDQIKLVKAHKADLLKHGLNLANLVDVPWIASLGGYFFPALNGGAIIVERTADGRRIISFESNTEIIARANLEGQRTVKLTSGVEENRVVEKVIHVTPMSGHSEAPTVGVPIKEIVVPVRNQNGEIEFKKITVMVPSEGNHSLQRRAFFDLMKEFAHVYGIDERIVNTYMDYLKGINKPERLENFVRWYMSCSDTERQQINMLIHIEREARLITKSTTHTFKRDITQSEINDIVTRYSQNNQNAANDIRAILTHMSTIRSRQNLHALAALVESEMGQGNGYRLVISRELPHLSLNPNTNVEILYRTSNASDSSHYGVARLRFVHLSEALEQVASNPSVQGISPNLVRTFAGNLLGFGVVISGFNTIMLSSFTGVLQYKTNITTLERGARYSQMQVLESELDYLYSLGSYSPIAYNIRFYRDLYNRLLETSRQNNIPQNLQTELLEHVREQGQYNQKLLRRSLGMYADADYRIFEQHYGNIQYRNAWSYWYDQLRRRGRNLWGFIDAEFIPSIAHTIPVANLWTMFSHRLNQETNGAIGFNQQEMMLIRDLRNFYNFKSSRIAINNVNNTLMMRERYHGTLADPFQIHEYALYSTWGGSGHWDIEAKMPYVHLGPYGGGMFLKNKTWFVSVGMYDWMRKMYSPLFHMAEMAAITTKPFIKAGMGWGNVYDERDNRIPQEQIWRNLVYDAMFSPLSATKSFLQYLPFLPISPLYSYKKYRGIFLNGPKAYFVDTGNEYVPFDDYVISRSFDRGYESHTNTSSSYRRLGSILPERYQRPGFLGSVANAFSTLGPFSAKKWELQYLTGYHEYYFDVPLDPFQFVVPHNVRMRRSTPGLGYTDMFNRRNLVQRMGYSLMQNPAHIGDIELFESATDYQFWRPRTHSAVENYVNATNNYWHMFRPMATVQRNALLPLMLYAPFLSNIVMPFNLELFPTYFVVSRGVGFTRWGVSKITNTARTLWQGNYGLSPMFRLIRNNRVPCARCGTTMSPDAHTCPGCGAIYRG